MQKLICACDTSIKNTKMTDIPRSSAAPYFRSGKTGENFARLCQLIMTICSDVLRDILSRFIKPADLRTKLDSEQQKLVGLLNPQQREELYPKSTGVNIRARNFDISMLYVLLRNICGIPDHSNGWGKSPLPGDYSLAACIERIRIQRNNVTGHLRTGAVDFVSFHSHWNELKEAVLEIEKEITGGDMYERGIDELYTCDLNPTNSEKFIKALKDDMEFKRKRIDGLQENMDEQIQVKRERLDTHDSRIQTIEQDVDSCKERLDTQDSRIEKIEQDVASCKDCIRQLEDRLPQTFSRQGRELEERLMKHISDQNIQQEERLLQKISDIYDHQILGSTSIHNKCRIHLHQVYLLFCSQCKLPVCSHCIKEQHKGHILDDLTSQSTPCLLKWRGIVKEVYKFTVCSNIIGHISCLNSDMAWISEFSGSLILVNLRGKVFVKMHTSGGYGYHTLTSTGELMLADWKNNCINKMSKNCLIETIARTGDWEPRCIHASRLNDDLLVGMQKNTSGTDDSVSDDGNYMKSRVARYSVTGCELQSFDIELRKGRNLHPMCITENRVSGDICILTGDVIGNEVLVMNRVGKHRFTYTGKESSLDDVCTIATDIIGHILIPISADEHKSRIEILDSNGNFISVLFGFPRSWSFSALSIDNNHGIWHGHGNTVTIYKYLQKEDDEDE